MARFALVSGVVLIILAGPALAGQTSGQFRVGIVIGGGAAPAVTTLEATSPTYTWGAAAISVSRAGFTAPRRTVRDGGVYWFLARKGSATYRVAVSVASGTVVKVTPA